MRTHHRTVLALAAFALALSPHARAERRAKPVPATKADIDRLDKRIDDQQKLIDKLVKLQQQYMQSVNSLFDSAHASVEPKPAEPAPVATPEPEPKPAEPKAVEQKVKAEPKAVKATKAEPKPGKTVTVGTIVGKVAGVSDAVVYVEDIVATTQGSASMKQQDKQFVPNVLVVPKGTTVQFPNLDAVFHNVFSMSPDNSFDLGSYRQGESKAVTMSRPGVISVYCNMHPQMVGHILVVPNPNYVRAGRDGFFRLPNVPAGRHRIVAWAPDAKPVIAEAEVVDSEVVTVELALKKGNAGRHTKKDGLPYGSYEQ